MHRNRPSINLKEHNYSHRSKERSSSFHGRKNHNSECLEVVGSASEWHFIKKIKE